MADYAKNTDVITLPVSLFNHETRDELVSANANHTNAANADDGEDGEESAPLRRFFSRSSMPRLKRNSKAFLGRFRKTSTPNKPDLKNRKSLKVTFLTIGPVNNEAQSYINKTLDGSTYPGQKLDPSASNEKKTELLKTQQANIRDQ